MASTTTSSTRRSAAWISARTSGGTPPRPSGNGCDPEKTARLRSGRRGLPHAQTGQGKGERSRQTAVRRPAPGGRIKQPAAGPAGGTLQRVLRPVDEDVVGGVPPRGPAGRPAFHQPGGTGTPPTREPRSPGAPKQVPHGPGSTMTGRQPAPHSPGMELMTK